MSQKYKAQLLAYKFAKEKKGFLSIDIFRKGSITKRWMTCGRPRCSCKTDINKRHGPYYWWTTKEKGKTKALLISKSFLAEARAYIKNYKLLKIKIKALSQLSEQIIQIKLKNLS